MLQINNLTEKETSSIIQKAAGKCQPPFVLLSLGFEGNSRGRLLPFDKRLFAANIEIAKPF
ncbi:TPA: hypothetical protein IZ356_002825 [Enterococcus faecium]|nr:hypothetical protein [Enterococcus faecium]HAR1480508.1 hypothetical protein [Enterococcus faecium]